MQDIAAVAASMRKNLNIDPKRLPRGLRHPLNMGHKASVELRDFAGELSSIAPMFSKFGESEGGAEHLSKLVAALQVVRHGFGSASEAATGLQSLMVGLERKHAKLEASGVQVFTTDPKTKQRVARDFFDIIDDIKKKKIDMVELLGDLGRVEGVKAAIELVSEKGNAEMHDLYNTALNSGQVTKDNATFMASSAGKLQKAWEEIKNSVAEALTPERVQAFADGMLKAAKFIMDAVAAINQFAGGGKTNDEANNFATRMLKAAGQTDSSLTPQEQEEKDQAMIAYAKSIVAGGGKGDVELAKAAGMYQGPIAESQGMPEWGSAAGRLEGAHRLLISEGEEKKFRNAYVDPWSQQRSVRSGGAFDSSITPADLDRLGRMIVDGVRGGMHMDAAKVSTAVADSKASRFTNTVPR
jgi:hypothetical protein